MNVDPASVINDIIKDKITLDKEQTKQNVSAIENFFRCKLIDSKLKEDPLFKMLFNEIYYTGSYYDGVRVDPAIEFDLNLKLDLSPILPILVFDQGVNSGFMSVELTSTSLSQVTNKPDWQRNWNQFVEKFARKDGNGKIYLIPDEFKKWLNILVIEKLNSLAEFYNPYAKIEYWVKTEMSKGPAVTLEFKASDTPIINVDLVPVLFFSNSILTKCPKATDLLMENNLMGRFDTFFLVPKLAPSFEFWSMSFHHLEIEIIKKNPNSKIIIKLLKVFRDSNREFEDIKSYALKTIVMEMVEQTSVIWTNADNASLFLKALEILQRKLSQGMIASLVPSGRHNLLKNPQDGARMGQLLAAKINRMKHVRDLNECRQVWRSLFGLS